MKLKNLRQFAIAIPWILPGLSSTIRKVCRHLLSKQENFSSLRFLVDGINMLFDQ
jgi:hypothetical protein